MGGCAVAWAIRVTRPTWRTTLSCASSRNASTAHPRPGAICAPWPTACARTCGGPRQIEQMWLEELAARPEALAPSAEHQVIVIQAQLEIDGVLRSMPVKAANEQPAYADANLMARYDFNRQLSATLNLNNMFDKKY